MSGVIDAVIQPVIDTVIRPVIGGDVGGIRLVSGVTEDTAGAPSTNQFTVCFAAPVTVVDPLSGATLTVNSVPTPITFVTNDGPGICYTYQLVSGTWQDGDTLMFCVDNSGGEWTDTGTGDPAASSCTGVVNLYTAPLALSASIPSTGDKIAVLFNTAVNDSGGDVSAYNCTKDIAVELQPPTGNGTDTLTYDTNDIYIGDEIKWTSAGVTITCIVVLDFNEDFNEDFG